MLDISNHYFEEEDDDYDESSSIYDQNPIRINTAPARPLTDIEEFKRSAEFLLLEQSVFSSSQLVQKGYQKYDIDSQEGQKRCKKFLNLLERLCEAFHIRTTSKDYRNEFSKAYQILYKEGQLNYLTEILDSAQEGFPYLFVNGEKYVFSVQVLDNGKKLLSSFYKVQHVLRNSYSKICQDSENLSISDTRYEIQQQLEEFDYIWANFEQLYVMELMIIENDARRYVTKAIELERELSSIEIREKMKGTILINSKDYHFLRKNMCKIISQINSVANFEGIGRDDLQFEILLEAEGLLRRISPEQSKAVRKIADKIRQSFIKIRQLFKYYEQNIEMVDPQLKNNADLVEALNNYEQSWEKGKQYFLDGKKTSHLIYFSHILETTAEKYSQFKEYLDYRDSDIFISIPCLMILKSLEREDKNICEYFFPNIQELDIYKQLQIDFEQWKNSFQKSYKYYNIVEKYILNIDLGEDEKQYSSILKTTIHKIKQIAIQLERSSPSDWNSFLESALESFTE